MEARELKVTELRIGNDIYDGVSTSKVCSSMLHYLEQNNDKSYKGIPLTEEILLRCGFKYDKSVEKLWFEAWSEGHPSQRFDMYWSEKDDFILSSRYQGFSENLKMRHIEYLHQLQNLYFALTNEELDIKL